MDFDLIFKIVVAASVIWVMADKKRKMKVTISFQTEHKPKLILYAFDKCKPVFSSSFNIDFIDTCKVDPNTKYFQIETEEPADLYRAGLIGADIENRVEKHLTSLLLNPFKDDYETM